MKSKRKPAPKKGGKSGMPTLYTADLAATICERIGCSSDSLYKVLADLKKESPNAAPVYRTVMIWLRDKPEFAAMYALAKEEQGDFLAQEIVAIADHADGDFVKNEEGELAYNPEHVQRSKLRVDARKWVASKLKPKVYGDKLDLNATVNYADMTEEQIAARIRKLSGMTEEQVSNLLMRKGG